MGNIKITKKKRCPLTYSAKEGANDLCIEERCAWYNFSEGECCIKTIALAQWRAHTK